MDVHFLGVRGSTPACGPGFVRYGGNTSAVALAHDGGDPALVLDAGTGLRNLSSLLGEAPFRGTILVGHLHWDHTHGLPFFPAGDRAGSRVHLHVPAQDGMDAVGLLDRAMSPPHFPIGVEALRGDWSFNILESGGHHFEGFEVLVRDIPHPGGRTFGFRVSDDSGSVAYLSDHWPVSLGQGPHGDGVFHDTAMELARGVDLLIHDAQYTRAEFPAKAMFGHSSVEYAAELAAAAGAQTLVLFHHEPWREDAQIDAIVAGLSGRSVPVVAAAEGLCLTVPAGRTDGGRPAVGGAATTR